MTGNVTSKSTIYGIHIFTILFYSGEVPVVGRNYTVSVFDTTGQHEFGGLRYFPYAQSNVVVLCYSVTDRASFNNIANFWIKEVKKHCRKSVPIILVSTQCDLAAGKSNYVKRNEGVLLAKKIGASRLIETSMYDLDNISTLFESVVTEAIEKKRNILKKLLGL